MALAKRTLLACAALIWVTPLHAQTITAISALPAASALAGTEPIPTVQSATTKKTTPSALLTYIQGAIALPASAITSGTLSSSLLAGSYTGITGVGTLSVGSIPQSLVTGLGTFATANAATPPAIGGTTPATIAATTLTAFHAGINSGSYTLGQFIQDVAGLPAQLVVPANIQRATDLATELTGLNTDYANFVAAVVGAAGT